MKVIIYGFATDIACHNIKDIYFFFLIFTVLIVITGRYIEKNCVSRRYMYLIRYRKIGNFWKRLWMKALLLTAAEAAVLFGGMGAITACAGWNVFQDGVILPLILWFVSLSAIASLQMAFGFSPGLFCSASALS